MRRLIDIAVAASVLILLAPLLLAIALAIRIDSRGNPIYLARRVGANGRQFRMWKFRTMVEGAAQLGAAITNRHDPRITRLGRVLRRTKLDELPQFINVLLGHMTLVGPRPEAPEIVAAYTSAQHAVLGAKPGITGCVQVQESAEEEQIPEGSRAEEYYVYHLMEGKIRRDLDYLRIRNFWSDTRIVLATAGLLLRPLRMRRVLSIWRSFHGNDTKSSLSSPEYWRGRN
jgi:lipopolysaccharide/colanic/teichoic acid biosynthesis glycosyltransferase